MIRNASSDRDERAEIDPEQLGEDLLADGADGERGERDAELHRGDEVRRVARDLHHGARGAAPFVGELLQPRPAHGDERVLGRDEEAVQQDQSGDAEKLERNRHAPVSGAAVLEGSSPTTARQYRRRRRRSRPALRRDVPPCRRARAARDGRASRRRRTGARQAADRRRRADTTPRSPCAAPARARAAADASRSSWCAISSRARPTGSVIGVAVAAVGDRRARARSSARARRDSPRADRAGSPARARPSA